MPTTRGVPWPARNSTAFSPECEAGHAVDAHFDIVNRATRLNDDHALVWSNRSLPSFLDLDLDARVNVAVGGVPLALR
jgi:hypothetical protein